LRCQVFGPETRNSGVARDCFNGAPAGYGEQAGG
jgi:hypothetical protein